MSSTVAVPSPHAQPPDGAVPFEPGEAPTHAKASRKAWDERMGETANVAKNYRNLSYACVAALVCMVGVSAYQSTQTKVRVLEVQRSMDGTQIVGVAEGISLTPSDYVVAGELRRWIEDLRFIYKDWNATRRGITEAYKMVATDSQASRELNRYYESAAGDPWVRKNKEYVLVTSDQAVPMTHDPNSKGERTWKLEWTEETHSVKDDSLIRTQFFSAVVTYFIQPHRGSDTDEQIKANPHGIMINFFAVS